MQHRELLLRNYSLTHSEKFKGLKAAFAVVQVSSCVQQACYQHRDGLDTYIHLSGFIHLTSVHLREFDCTPYSALHKSHDEWQAAAADQL